MSTNLPNFIPTNPCGHYDHCLDGYVIPAAPLPLKTPRPSPTLWQAFWAYLAWIVE